MNVDITLWITHGLFVRVGTTQAEPRADIYLRLTRIDLGLEWR